MITAEVLCPWVEPVGADDLRRALVADVLVAAAPQSEPWSQSNAVGRSGSELPTTPNMTVALVTTTPEGIAAIEADPDCVILWSDEK